MWDRSIIKSNAKLALRGRYWVAYGVCIVAALISGAFSFLTAPVMASYRSLVENYEENLSAIMAQSGMVNLISVGSALFTIFVGIPLAVGAARFFLQNRYGRTDFHLLFSGFSLNYLGCVGALFVTYLFIGLWALLLLIPGIIKALEYSMVPYILADNPYIPGSRARELSRQLTRGEKGGVFVFVLSFFGWFLLASIPAGIVLAVLNPLGYIGFGESFKSIFLTACITLVVPYMSASFAELYIFLRDRAVQSGQVNPGEFGLVPPPAPAEPPVPPTDFSPMA